MPRPLAPSRFVNVEDLRRAARDRVPRVVFDYIDGGADAEVTLRENCRAFEEITFRPRSAVATPSCDLRTTVVGASLAMPFVLAPIGSSRMFYPRGEEAAARAAGAADTAYVLSTFSGCRLEDVKRSTSGPAWLQLYLCGDRGSTIAMLERAQAVGYSALVVTIDTAVAGNRERDIRNGSKALVGAHWLPMVPHVRQLFVRPRWLAGFLRDGGLMTFPNVLLPDGGAMPYADVGAALEKAVVTWNDLGWIRDVWKGPVIVKGVQTAADALRAAAEGAHAVVVSNHGGRQLDGVAATVRILPEVVAAVGSRVDVLMDGGIRRGGDIVKALCLGARAVLIGRAYAYGLAAAGERGVTRAIEILRADLVRTLKLLGCSSVSALDRSYVDVGPRQGPR